MSIKTKPADGSWHVVTQPWVKTDDTTWRRATKVFVKVNGAWAESWPLQPGPVRNVIATTTYRNDRIEIDVDWDAPVTGEAVGQYIIDVWIGPSLGAWYFASRFLVNAPSTAMTLTNGGNGFHGFAGMQVYVSIWAQSVAGRIGDGVSALPVTVAQLPPPDAPYSYTMNISVCAAYHYWSTDQGRRVDGVQLVTEFNGGQGPWPQFAKGTNSVQWQHWDPNSIGGGWVVCYLRTYGPGGVSGWVTVSGTMPNPVDTWSFRFLNNQMVVQAVGGISPAVRIYLAFYGGDWGYWTDIGAGVGSIVVGGSENWARDGNAWTMLMRPINLDNGWTGRDQWLGWVRKIPWPYHVVPQYNSQTMRNGQWRPEANYEYQGASQSGMNTAYFFYGNVWYDELNAGYLGFTLGINSAYIGIQRANTGGQGAAISPRLIVHRAEHGYGDLSIGGAFDTNALVRNQLGWCVVPPEWISYLCQRADWWRGLGLYHGNGQLLSYLGYVSAEYSIYTSTEYGSIDGFPLHTVRVYHDG